MKQRREAYPRSSWEDDYKFCEAETKKYTEDLGFWMGWRNLWAGIGWHLLWFVPVVVLVPPLIVYGTIWLIVKIIVKTSLWVAAGFRESHG